jgi:tRNA1Val (adenine37-N6)-methyltransferase
VAFFYVCGLNMSNSYFQFKQFRVEQDKAAMKVCTDACIFGASIEPFSAKNILDIGTGTGLLSLMVAQKTEAIIDAVEIEKNAFDQAKINFINSPWSEKLSIFNIPIQNYNPEKKYDLIICNPPFFPNHLKSQNKDKNTALHNDSLTFSDLLLAINRLLHQEGCFYLLLPPSQMTHFIELSVKANLYPCERIIIQDKIELPPIRIIARFEYNKVKEIKESNLIIKSPNNSYSSDFKQLLKEYYLAF